MPDTVTENLVEVKNIGEREHPDYKRKRELWDFLMASYRGGLGVSNRYDGLTNALNDYTAIRSGYYPGLFKFRREEDEDYSLRVQMTPYRPYARRIVKTFAKYVTKDNPVREGVDKYSVLIDNIDRKRTPLTLFTRNILSMYLSLGSMNILVDMPSVDVTPASRKHADDLGLRPYAIPILPQQIVDYDLDEYGKYKWLIIQSTHVVNDPKKDGAEEITRRTYWDSEIWRVYEKGSDGIYKPGKNGTHTCGRVPVVRVIEDDIDNDVITPEAWFYDLADINRAIYNLDSLDLANFYYQTLGILVLPGKSTGTNETAVELSNKTAIFENGQEENGITRFVAPDGTPYEMFDKKIETLKLEMYRIAGLSQRKDTREAESAESKEWDFQETNQFLASVAHIANYVESETLSIAAAYMGNSFDGNIKYPSDYKVAEVSKTIEAALDLKQLGFGTETGRKEVLKRMYRELLPDLSTDLKDKIDVEIEESAETDPLMNLGLRNIAQEGGSFIS